jgi:uncharacterized OsmC-like protein
MESTQFTVALDLRDEYAFTVTFDQDSMGTLLTDEPAPLGQGSGPNPSRLLAAAVGNCLAASLLYCLRRARIEVAGLHATVTASLQRNDAGRLRVGQFRVELKPELVHPADRARMGRCLEIFQDFCVVTESVRNGIPVAVEVATPVGVE